MMQVLTRRVIGRISPIAVNACRLWLAVGVLTLVPGMLAGALAEEREFWQFVRERKKLWLLPILLILLLLSGIITLTAGSALSLRHRAMKSSSCWPVRSF